MQTKNTWVKPLIVIVAVSGLCSLAVSNRTESEMKKLEFTNQKLQNESDSLRSEIFILQTEIGRYEMGVEIFKERNPKGAQQIDDIISHETE